MMGDEGDYEKDSQVCDQENDTQTSPPSSQKTVGKMDDMDESIPMLLSCQKELSLSSIQAHIKNSSNSTPVMPQRPQGGAVYLYFNPEREEDWRADGYRWYGSGRRLLPPSAPLLLKKYFQVLIQGKGIPVNSKHFRKNVYHLATDAEGTQGTLIHYIGTAPDESVLYQPKKDKLRKQLMRTTQSVLEEARKLKQDPVMLEKMKNACFKTMEQETVVKARKLRKDAKVRKFCQEEVCNLVEMTHDLQDYIHMFFLVPEVGVVLAHRAMLHEFRSVLSTPTQQPQLLSYNITEKIGNYFVSPLLFKHTLFSEAPVMPVAFLIHESKSQYAQGMFMSFMAKEVPEMIGALFVTSGEENVLKAMQNKLPQVWHLCGWRQVQASVRRWLKQQGATDVGCRSHLTQFKELLMCATEAEYKRRLEEFTQKWSDSFVEYYKQKIHPVVSHYAGRWILEPLGVYNGYTGVTTNHCQGFDTLLQTFVDRQESAIESFALAFYYLQSYFNNEIQRSFAGVGNYNLLNTFDSLRIRSEGMQLQHSYAPGEILEKMMEQKKQEEGPSLNQGVSSGVEEGKVERQGLLDSSIDSLTTTQQSTNNSRNKTKNGIKVNKANGSIALCQMARARQVLENHKLVYNEQAKTFIVQGNSGPYEIKLFPKAVCTCPVKKQCYHILAVKLYMGIDVKPSKRMSLTQLKRNISAKTCASNGEEAKKKRNKERNKKRILENEEVALQKYNNDTTSLTYDSFFQDMSLLQSFPSTAPSLPPQNVSLPKLVSLNGMNHLANLTIIRKCNNQSTSSSFNDQPTFTSNS